ncbi:MAG: hypothetical protein LBF62_14265 [Tannerellaceae bacterium]|jgi:hypothetical protein|nr:hypothetical protein [Tannerellaceae bacterium]
MKRIYVILLAISGGFAQALSSQALSSQVMIRVNNGVGISSLKGRDGIFGDVITPYTFSLGADYLNGRYWGLSSDVSFMGIGGMEKVWYASDAGMLPGVETKVREKSNFVQLNTTFRVKSSRTLQALYLGLGPSLSLRVSNGKFKRMLTGYDVARLLYGLKAEVGINGCLTGRWHAGINAGYIHNFNRFARSLGGGDTFRSSVFTCTLMLGYAF